MEQVLHQLDDFTDGDGFRVTWCDSSHGQLDAGAVMLWKIRKQDAVAWLAMVDGGYSWGVKGPLHALHARADRWHRSAEAALAQCKETLLARDAARRLAGKDAW